MKFPSQLTCHRLCGLDTLTTKTSAKGSGARTPEIKSSMRSAGDSLFLPRLTASTAPSRRAARSDGLPKKFVIRARIREKTEELHQHDTVGSHESHHKDDEVEINSRDCTRNAVSRFFNVHSTY